MANSGYYKNLYRDNKKKAFNLGKNSESLVKIRNSVWNDFGDEQHRVNRGVDNLRGDLRKAVRHDASWNSVSSKCEEHKERDSSSDGFLSAAVEFLNAEIQSVEAQKTTAEIDRDRAYNDYQTEKTKEYKEFLEGITNIF